MPKLIDITPPYGYQPKIEWFEFYTNNLMIANDLEQFLLRTDLFAARRSGSALTWELSNWKKSIT
jgi:hypothetical protein